MTLMFSEWLFSFRLVVPFEFGGIEMIFEVQAEWDKVGEECAVRTERGPLIVNNGWGEKEA